MEQAARRRTLSPLLRISVGKVRWWGVAMALGSAPVRRRHVAGIARRPRRSVYPLIPRYVQDYSMVCTFALAFRPGERSRGDTRECVRRRSYFLSYFKLAVANGRPPSRPCSRRTARRRLSSSSTSPSRRPNDHPVAVPHHRLPQRGGGRRRQPPRHLRHHLPGGAAPLQLLPQVLQRLPPEHWRSVIEQAARRHRPPMRCAGISCSSPRRRRSSRRMGSR